eukprot:m.202590 g.202590  ORF g.202590 m.202590 type:complete len:74 (+) comp14977_c1_seq14:2352-2573(+)
MLCVSCPTAFTDDVPAECAPQQPEQTPNNNHNTPSAKRQTQCEQHGLQQVHCIHALHVRTRMLTYANFTVRSC